jgi:hypothetical protein
MYNSPVGLLANFERERAAWGQTPLFTQAQHHCSACPRHDRSSLSTNEKTSAWLLCAIRQLHARPFEPIRANGFAASNAAGIRRRPPAAPQPARRHHINLHGLQECFLLLLQHVADWTQLTTRIVDRTISTTSGQ